MRRSRAHRELVAVGESIPQDFAPDDDGLVATDGHREVCTVYQLAAAARYSAEPLLNWLGECWARDT